MQLSPRELREMRDRSERPRGVGAGRLLFPVVMLLLISASCGGYGLQIAQQRGLAAAQYTFILAGILALVAFIMLTAAILSIRAGHREAQTARDSGGASGSTWTQTRRERGSYYR